MLLNLEVRSAVAEAERGDHDVDDPCASGDEYCVAVLRTFLARLSPMDGDLEAGLVPEGTLF